MVGIPLAAGDLARPSVVRSCLIAFLVFVLASVAVYVINDLRDVDLDRRHPSKKFRPIASGEISCKTALFIATIALGLAIAIPIATDTNELLLVAAIYVVIQIGYQVGLKNVAIVELAIVSSGFVIRAIAGGVAASIPITPWFMSVVGSGALFAVSAKRYSEIKFNGVQQGSRPVLSSYTSSYLQLIWTVSLACSIIFYALWAVEAGNAQGTKDVYSLLSVVPFSLLMLRYAEHADRGLAESPEVLLSQDRYMQVVSSIWVALYWIYST